MRMFQRDMYIAVDFGENVTEILTLTDAISGEDALTIDINTGNSFKRKHYICINRKWFLLMQ